MDTVFDYPLSASDPYVNLPSRFLAIDTETTGTRLHHGHKPFAVSACNQSGQTFFWRAPVNPKTREPKWSNKQLKEMFNVFDSYPICVFHNAKFDIRALSKISEDIYKNLTYDNWELVRDTLLYSHVLDSWESHGLKDQAAKYLGIPADDEAALRKAVVSARRQHKKSGCEPSEEVGWDYWLAGDELEEYSVQDARRTLLLYVMQNDVLKKLEAERIKDARIAKTAADKTRWKYGLPWQVFREHLLLPYVYAMEERGIRLRKATLREEQDRFRSVSMTETTTVKRIAASVGLDTFNPRSSQQLQFLLFDKWRLPSLKTTNGGGDSTDADTLKTLLDRSSPESKPGRFLRALLTARRANKAVDYLTEYERLSLTESHSLKKSLIHVLKPSFNQVGTSTTRFSSSDPNAQNVSTKEDMPLREVFGPRPGHYWIDADYDNLEMRLFAYACGEKSLIEAFESGESVHLVIAEELHGPRAKWKNLNKENWKKSPEYKSTKNGNFSLIYGAGPTRANATYGVSNAYDRIRGRFKKLDSFMQKVVEDASRKGYVETMFGYRLQISKDKAYSALNYLIQGTAGDVMKYAILHLSQRLANAFRNDRNGRIVMTVHDELVVEFTDNIHVLDAACSVKEYMEQPGEQIGIPLPVSPELIRTKWTQPEVVKGLS